MHCNMGRKQRPRMGGKSGTLELESRPARSIETVVPERGSKGNAVRAYGFHSAERAMPRLPPQL